MRCGVALVAVVGLFAGAALANGETSVRSQLAFARLQSPSFGIAAISDAVTCGASCTTYRSHIFVTDHGRWREVTPPHMLWQIEDVVFSSPLVGWVVANDCAAAKAFVYRTADGGRTWRAAPVRSTNCAAGSRLDLSLSDNRHGWILDVYANGNRFPLARTSDGGETWQQVNATAPLAGTIVFATARDGSVSRSDFASPQQLFATRDGGRTWRHQTLKAPRGWTGAKLFPDAPTFFDKRGVLPVDVVLRTRAAVAFYTTGDNGRTWQPGAVHPVQSSIAPPHSPFVRYVPTSVVSPSLWWVSAGRTRSTIAVTTDAGKSWRGSTLPVRASELSAVDAQRAWLMTPEPRSTLYTTSDGGRNWRRLMVPTP